jgi:sporulation protein YtfJ
MTDIIKASLDGIKDFADVDTVFGKAITTPSGVTVIPVSKVSLGFASGGLDFGTKKIATPQSFGGGSGTGVSITPVAFLAVSPTADINLIQITEKSPTSLDRTLQLIESSPEIIEKIKNTFSG